MQKIADIWYCSFNELVNSCLISEITIKMGFQRSSKQWESIADPDDRRRRLIRYDTMAQKYQMLVRRVLCNDFEPWEFAAQKKVNILSERSISELVELILKDGYRRYCGLYPAEDTSRTALKTQTCLARAAAVVELIGNYVQEREIDERSYQPYKEVIAWLEQDDNYDFYFPKGCQYLPKNPIRLKEKVVQRFGKIGAEPQPITDVIKLPRADNKSRDKFQSDKELMAWIAIARSSPRNSGAPNEYVIREIQRACKAQGREVPSNGWFSQVLNSNKMKAITAEGRFGKGTQLASRFEPYISVAQAMYAGDCWMIDATRVNFIEHKVGKTGSHFDFLSVIAVRDAYSGHILGVHFDTKEDRWGYVNALKMAFKTCGYLPHTLVHDRFPGHNTDEMKSVLDTFERKGVEIVCTHKATGKAMLERWFGTLQTVFFPNSPYYYGEGIRSTRTYAHRSPEYLVKIRKEASALGWNFDIAWQEAWQRIEEYVSTPLAAYSKKHKACLLSPSQLHEQSEKPHVIKVDLWDQATLFWNTKVLQIDRTRIEQEVHGVKYKYQIYDQNILYRYDRVAVRYEEHDPTKVMLFAVHDGKATDFFITQLEHSSDVHVYGPDADLGHLMARQEKQNQLRDAIKADLDEVTSHAEFAPEYLLTMGGRVSKEAFESAQTALIYEQMGATIAADAHRPAKEKRAKQPPKALPVKPTEGDFDTSGWVNNSFFNQ